MFFFLKRKYSSLTGDKKFSEIFTGSIWALAARVMATVLGMVIIIIVTRLYGAEAMGILALVQTLVMFVTIFTVLGTQTSILRLIPEHISKYSITSAFRVYSKTQNLVAFTAFLTGTLIFIFSGFLAETVFTKPHLTVFFTLASAFVIFKSIMDLNTYALRGLRLIRLYSFVLTLPYLSMLICLITLTLYSRSLGNPVYAQFAGWTITAVTGAWIMSRAFKKRIQPDDFVQTMTSKDILTLSLPMLMTASMQFFIGQTGVLLLGVFRTETEVGYYAVAVRLATLTAFILQAINSMAGPKFSELYHSGKIDELFYVARKSSKLIFWTTAPILITLLACGKIVLSLLFGLEFQIAYTALAFLVVGQFVNAISGSTAIFMNMTGNEKKLRDIVFGAAVINIILNLFLVPRLGINGAAIAAAVSMSYWNVYILIFIKLKYGLSIGYSPISIKTK